MDGLARETGDDSRRRPRGARRHGTSATVYASFNGSTETAYWSVLGGAARNALRPLTVARRNGFETTVNLRNAPAHLAVKALDAHRRPIATSRVF